MLSRVGLTLSQLNIKAFIVVHALHRRANKTVLNRAEAR